ncbi:hypothetical protein GWI33_008997 [Rhynchophorus ferrugineus]|uniref:Uncharacterized protein n=1 Tax=Rhynchophorus ferrugineus TaxID=354439 RepID=A0A834IFE3_RHYFE|nr:hypothetical protein GWI33_008997 [Rhynchophorus ferrugineus]
MPLPQFRQTASDADNAGFLSSVPPCSRVRLHGGYVMPPGMFSLSEAIPLLCNSVVPSVSCSSTKSHNKIDDD